MSKSTLPTERPSIVLACAWFLLVAPLFSAYGLAYYYWWSRAPAVPLVLGSIVFGVAVWRGLRYTRGGYVPGARELGFTVAIGLELLLFGLIDIGLYCLLITVLDFPQSANVSMWLAPIVAVVGLTLVGLASPLMSVLSRAIREVSTRLGQMPRFSERVVVVLSVYVGVDIVFAAFFQFLALVQPGCFSASLSEFTAALYFSTVTIATVGYGDIVPLTDVARVLVVVEVLSGIVLLVVVLSTVVAVSTAGASGAVGKRRRLRRRTDLDIPTVWRQGSARLPWDAVRAVQQRFEPEGSVTDWRI